MARWLNLDPVCSPPTHLSLLPEPCPQPEHLVDICLLQSPTEVSRISLSRFQGRELLEGEARETNECLSGFPQQILQLSKECISWEFYLRSLSRRLFFYSPMEMSKSRNGSSLLLMAMSLEKLLLQALPLIRTLSMPRREETPVTLTA